MSRNSVPEIYKVTKRWQYLKMSTFSSLLLAMLVAGNFISAFFLYIYIFFCIEENIFSIYIYCFSASTFIGGKIGSETN